jgi:hypothetical protein
LICTDTPKGLAYTTYGSDALASQDLLIPLSEADIKNTASPNGIGGRESLKAHFHEIIYVNISINRIRYKQQNFNY